MLAKIYMILFHPHLAFISSSSSSFSAPGMLTTLLFLKLGRHASALEPPL